MALRRIDVAGYLATAIVLLSLAGGGFSLHPAISAEHSVSDQIRFRIESGGLPLKISVEEEPVYAAVALPVFYERRVFQPAWTDGRNLLPQAGALLRAIRLADREGLNPDDYHLQKIECILSQAYHQQDIETTPDPNRLADLDLVLTDAFLIYASHLLAGRIDPEKLDPQWRADRRETDLAAVLEGALNSNRIEEALAGLLPVHDGYKHLRDALLRYGDIARAGNWPTIPDGKSLRPGDRSDRVALLRTRLVSEGYLQGDGGIEDPELLDAELENAVILFQTRNGLESDGIVGSRTLQALNTTVHQRVRRIAVNMERWRWLPQALGDRYVLVNIARFNLDVVEKEKTVLTMRAVVGRSYRKTPVFSDRITYLVIHPYWTVPAVIAKNDLLPKIRKDPGFLTEQKIRVFESWKIDAPEIDPALVDWNAMTADGLTFRFKQDPGPLNALGRIKFMFPNSFNVYLHDTNLEELFAKTRRDFSSGCIRIEKPVELAEYLLRSHPEWPPDKIRSVVTGNDYSTQTVKLTEPINVHILYWTVWSEKDGDINFSPDIYNRDAAVDEALQERHPGS